ncbi:MAG TPA: ATP-binding protein [Euryarchaeota archaeon]|nr:ATP-binding protein [Euryarchaeota archaeon]
MLGRIISGNTGLLIARKHSRERVELGELVVAPLNNESKLLLQVVDIGYSSQLDKKLLEFIAGISVEHGESIDEFGKELRYYELLSLTPLLEIRDSNVSAPRVLPSIFTPIYRVDSKDLWFLGGKGISLGFIRSGSNVLDIEAKLPVEKMLSHHVLITGTTGRGKSVLMKNLLWQLLDLDNVSCLVIDPHNEYYGINGKGLRLHRNASDSLLYYSPVNYPGAISLIVNISLLRPEHLSIIDFSDAQWQLMNAYYKNYRDKWIEALLLGEELPESLKKSFNEATINVTRRKISLLLDIEIKNNSIIPRGIFTTNGGESTIKSITNALMNGKIVIIDTSTIKSELELLISNMITREVYREKLSRIHKQEQSPIISIVLEEAPRVLKNNENIFSTITREGRKFGIGLIAITQMPSLIPRELLANMNTKIILGTELSSEREAVINSASQDIKYLDRTIASMNKGEAIVTSTFSSIALPIKIPFFDEEIALKEEKEKKKYIGL